MFATILEKLAGLRYRVATAKGWLYRRGFQEFGAGSVLMNPIMLQGVKRIRIGGHNLFRDGSWLGCEQGGSITIGEHNYFGYRLHVHAIDPVSIGSRCVFADNVYITSTDHDRIDRHSVHGTGPVHIGDGVFLGQNVTVLGGVTIGDNATVGAGAVVTRDIPADAIAVGVPARVKSNTQ